MAQKKRKARWERARYYVKLGNNLESQGKFDEAEANLRQALKLVPEFEDAHNILGIILWNQGKLEEAEASYRRVIKLSPDHVAAHNNLGNVLRDQGRFDEAAASILFAIQLNPGNAKAHNNLGNIQWNQGKLDEAATSYQSAIEINSGYAKAHNNLGNILRAQGKLDEAATGFRRAIQADPGYAKAHNGLGDLLKAEGKFSEAATCYRRVLGLNPDDVETHYKLGRALSKLGEHESAIECFRHVVSVDPNHPHAFTELVRVLQVTCDWSDIAETTREITARVRSGQSIISPFMFLSVSEDPGDQLRCAQRYLEYRVGSAPMSATHQESGRVHDRIRIAYLSADFQYHATSILMAELFELHDRKKFEVFAFSFGPDEQDSMRRRLVDAFDHFIDVREMSDDEAATHIRDLGIDIAIDLSGYTKGSRPGILARRPAPVQVNHLVYAGTTGADFIDYIIVDRFIVPSDQQPYFSEKLVHLPDCYQVNDSTRSIPENLPSRVSCGLPEGGFVFCCFCNAYKITPAVFDIWMRLLGSIPGSVLWLLSSNETADGNFRREAQERGVDPERLVFAPRTSVSAHLARMALADLFLDTLPYNAHTTASEALWAGLPVLTRVGKVFPGRVCASILHAVGLPELVTDSPVEYEASALRLARDPALLGAIRAKIEQNRVSAPLFDTNRFRRNIEAAYTEMWDIWESGQSPKAFTVQNRSE